MNIALILLLFGQKLDLGSLLVDRTPCGRKTGLLMAFVHYRPTSCSASFTQIPATYLQLFS